jgi:hypothetical protein
MAKYKFKIEADGVDISSAVLAGFTITNGRNILTQGFVQWSASLQTFKKDLKEILATAGKDSDFVSPGTEIKISVETAPSTWLTMFRGIIVSSSASDYQFRFECIDEVFFGFSQAQPKDVGFNVNLDNYISSVSVAAETKFRFDGDITLTNQFPFYAPGASIRGDYATVINEAAQTAKYTFLELYLPDDRTAVPIQLGQFFAGELENISIASTDFSIDDNDIDLNYSIQRNASDIYNTIQVDYDGGSITAVDNTSVAKMGTKLLVIDSQFTDPPPGGYTTPTKAVAARALAEALLQQHGLWGYALIRFSTSADRLGLTVENTVKKVFPKKVIDSSAVTAEEFQAKMVIQEVEHRCSPDYWEINLVAANYRFVNTPQTWAEVTSSLTWADVPDYLTWDMIRTKDL